jgi:hypothetical protein
MKGGLMVTALLRLHLEKSSAVSWDEAGCGSAFRWNFGGAYCIHLQGRVQHILNLEDRGKASIRKVSVTYTVKVFHRLFHLNNYMLLSSSTVGKATG